MYAALRKAKLSSYFNTARHFKVTFLAKVDEIWCLSVSQTVVQMVWRHVRLVHRSSKCAMTSNKVLL